MSKASPAVPQRERKHAVELADHSVAVLFVKVRQHFRVRSAAKCMSTLFELCAQLAIVVDLAVEDYRDALVFVEAGCSPVTRSMIASRRMPSATPLVTNSLLSQATMDHALTHRVEQSRAPAGGGVCESRLAQPVIPHMLFRICRC